MTAFVPHDGDRKGTAIVLIGTARDAGLNDRYHVRLGQGGFYISDELADLLYDEQGEGEEQPEQESGAPKKASGNRAAKKNSKEE